MDMYMKIKHGFLELLEEKNYTEISVKDITTKAHLSRTSFYIYWKNKDELIEDIYNQFLENFTEKLVHAMKFTHMSRNPRDIRPLFEYVDEFRNVLLIMWDIKSKDSTLYMFMQQAIKKSIVSYFDKLNLKNITESKLKLFTDYYASYIMITIQWWIENSEPGDYDFVCQTIFDCSYKGFHNLLMQ